jgi:hypothetical protein
MFYIFLLGIKPAASYHHSTAMGGSTAMGRKNWKRLIKHNRTGEEPREHRGLDSFPLQKGLIFERMPLTAEVPVSRPRWLGFSDCPCPIAVLQRAPRLLLGFRAEGVGR